MVDVGQLGRRAVLRPRHRFIAVDDERRVGRALLDVTLLGNNGDCTWTFDNGSAGFAFHFSLLETEAD